MTGRSSGLELEQHSTNTRQPRATTSDVSCLAPKKAKRRAEGGGSNVFSMFEQAQIQEFKEAFTIMDQNRDGFIDKNDLRDTFAALGRLNVKQEEIDGMLKEAPGPINFTVFLTMFGEKLKGADPEETILNAFKVFDPEGKGILKKDFLTDMLTTQADRFSPEEVSHMYKWLFNFFIESEIKLITDVSFP
uniref:EF-hand domain-containing protein n=1 Tax=Monopterus albus TaxID=43700 RepID=A0A3Q3IIT2_MONAL